MLISFPFSAFFGMHLIATIFPVAFSRAITTSENAPLQEKRRNTSSPFRAKQLSVSRRGTVDGRGSRGQSPQLPSSCAAKSTANTFKDGRQRVFLCHLFPYTRAFKANMKLREYLSKQSVCVAMKPHSVHLNKSGRSPVTPSHFHYTLSKAAFSCWCS